MTTWYPEVTHRGVTVWHYKENGKFYNFYFVGKPVYEKTIGIVQVRGIKEPLTEKELRVHIDKLIERSA